MVLHNMRQRKTDRSASRANEDIIGLRQNVDDALARLREMPRFEGVLEERYQSSTFRSRTRQYQLWLRSIGAICLVNVSFALGTDIRRLHSAISTGILMALVAFLGSIFIGMEASRARDCAPQRQRVSVVLVGIDTLLVLGAGYMGGIMPDPASQWYLMMAGLCLGAANVLLPLSVRASRAATIGGTLSLVALGLFGMTAGVMWKSGPVLTSLVILSFMTLRLRGRLEMLRRRSFLLGLRDRALVQELQRANAKLAALATIDGLTGVANRRHFDDMLGQSWDLAMALKTPIGLLMLDIDHFKTVNDSQGHAVGDEWLRQIGRTIMELVRASDVVARYGGEEFAVIMPDTDLPDLLAIAERIRGAVEAVKIVNPADPAPQSVTVSIGAASCHPCARAVGWADFLRQADLALYEAKNAGRNRVLSRVVAQQEPVA
jgi:diguanylate cyclase (GGDEF)-like protein